MGVKMTGTETESAKTLGQAIDEITSILKALDPNSRTIIIRTICDHLDIPFIEKDQSKPVREESHVSRGPSDIRSFKEEKNPSSANEMAAVVAFYLSELAPEQNRKTDVDVEDIIQYFKQASFPLPRVTQQLLVNAKNAGYFDSIGSGKYKLNPVGYNLVAHKLPRSGQATAAKPTKKRVKKIKRIRQSKEAQ